MVNRRCKCKHRLKREGGGNNRSNHWRRRWAGTRTWWSGGCRCRRGRCAILGAVKTSTSCTFPLMKIHSCFIPIVTMMSDMLVNIRREKEEEQSIIMNTSIRISFDNTKRHSWQGWLNWNGLLDVRIEFELVLKFAIHLTNQLKDQWSTKLRVLGFCDSTKGA